MAMQHAPNPPGFYAGFLGSEGTRFYQQHTNDIHYTIYHPPCGGNPKLRQRATAIAQGLTMVSPELRTAHGPPDADGYPTWETWQRNNAHVARVFVVCKGPSQPGPFPPWPVGLLEHRVVAWVGGQWRWGYLVRWYHETVEWQIGQNMPPIPNAPAIPMFYHEHERRQADQHYDTLTIKAFGKHCCFNFLKFGTQWQVFRRAAHRAD